MGECRYCQSKETHLIDGMCGACYEDEYDDRNDSWDDEDDWTVGVAQNCKCGAWRFNGKGQVIHVADCCCGAE